MSSLKENMPVRLVRKMNAVKELTSKNENNLENKLPTEDNQDDGQLPSMSSSEGAKQQQKNNEVTILKIHRWPGQHISLIPLLPNTPGTLKGDQSPNVGCTIVVDAAKKVDQQSSNNSKQDVVGAQPQRMQPGQQQIQQEQPQSTDVSPMVEGCPGKAADEDELKFNGCCHACFYYTMKCCDIFGIV